MTTYSSGINAILARMETNPAEFFGDGGKWRFIFKENFREVMTEPEKGALHEKLKEVRRQEFDHMVMRTILDDQMQGAFGGAAIKQEGQRILQNEFDRAYTNTAINPYTISNTNSCK
jgi:hypothetical protein